MSYDTKCHQLAQHFLNDCKLEPEEYPALADRLAGVIQAAVDEWIEDYIPQEKRP